MELTVDQALQQGIAAHKEGELQDAERLYRAVLQAQPNHPDANHNLGLLAMSVDKPLEAIPLFKLALDANPQIEQFWLSYADALMTLGRFDEAKLVLFQGEESGVSLEKLDALKRRLQASVTYDTKKNAKGQTLSEKRKRLAEKKKSKKRKVRGDPSSAAPSQDQINRLLELYQAGTLKSAEALATSLTQQFPRHPFGWKVLGAVLRRVGRLEESLAPMQSAVKLSPQDAEAHYNLGSTLQELGGLDEAEASYRQAIALKPDFAEAHYNLGNTLKELGRSDEAEASYRQAIAVKPDLAEAHYNLGNILKELGRSNEAEASYGQAIALKPENSSAKHFLDALSGNTTESAPLDYVERLFDNYASKFEKSLVDNLEYQIPKLIAEIILKDCNSDSLGSVIDLGCGTGLLGVEIRQFCKHLEGLDLSQKMLNEAKSKSVYDKLIKQDILGYLASADLNFDYFIATDVFVYIGDLSDMFQLIKSRNKTSGKLVFSTENCDGDDFLLQQSGRYSHSRMYVEGLCEKFGYQPSHFETQPLRKEKNKYITGGLYILNF